MWSKERQTIYLCKCQIAKSFVRSSKLMVLSMHLFWHKTKILYENVQSCRIFAPPTQIKCNKVIGKWRCLAPWGLSKIVNTQHNQIQVNEWMWSVSKWNGNDICIALQQTFDFELISWDDTWDALVLIRFVENAGILRQFIQFEKHSVLSFDVRHGYSNIFSLIRLNYAGTH